MDKEQLIFAAVEIRKLARDLEDIYGRLGVGAVCDSMRDRADNLERTSTLI